VSRSLWPALRWVALLETVSFAVLLVGSALRRTTDVDLVPVVGAVHGGLYLALVALVLANWRRLGWAPWFALVMLTVGSPGAHFAVAATDRRRPSGPTEDGVAAPAPTRA
jgi:integral membrane protein